MIPDTSLDNALHIIYFNQKLAKCYSIENNLDSAAARYKWGMDYYESRGIHDNININDNYANDCIEYGKILIKKNMLDSARVVYQKILDIKPLIQLLVSHTYIALSMLEYKKGNLSASFKYLDLAKPYVEANKTDKDLYRGYSLQMGTNYLSTKDYNKALNHFLSSYSLEVKDLEHSLAWGYLIPTIDTIAYTYSLMGNHKKAVEYMRMANEYRKGLLEEYSKQVVAEQEIEVAEQQRALATANVERRKLERNIALAGIVVAVFALGFAAYQLTIRRKLYDALDVEKRKGEALLLNMLPERIANRIMNNKESKIADAFDKASVIFIDIVGFTQLADKHDPHEIVDMLNEIFVHFDQLTDRFGLEKIKTIGDCYMAVSGIPNQHQDHLHNCIKLAIAILQEQKFEFFGIPINFRIGIETGTVVAGIIGEKRFLYDLWGDVVNTASRMESNGVPGAIHTTANVYEQMNHLYKFESRGIINIKGKGNMETYLLRVE
jgi:class 3 adenylate cyclase